MVDEEGEEVIREYRGASVKLDLSEGIGGQKYG